MGGVCSCNDRQENKSEMIMAYGSDNHNKTPNISTKIITGHSFKTGDNNKKTKLEIVKAEDLALLKIKKIVLIQRQVRQFIKLKKRSKPEKKVKFFKIEYFT
jgi:hypothetical protein